MHLMISQNFAVIGCMVFESIEYRQTNKHIHFYIYYIYNNKWNDLLQSLDKGSSPFWNLTKIISLQSAVV